MGSWSTTLALRKKGRMRSKEMAVQCLEKLCKRKNDLDIFDRINQLILDISRETFKGLANRSL